MNHWYKTAQQEPDETLYHGGPDVGDPPVLRTGYQGGKHTGIDAGAIFFTPSEQYARQYAKHPKGVYKYRIPSGERIFDLTNQECVHQFMEGSQNWDDYDSPQEAEKSAAMMIADMRNTASYGAPDWATASQYIDEMMQSGFTGAKFLERPGENIEMMDDGSFKVSGKPVYSYALFKTEIPVERS